MQEKFVNIFLLIFQLDQINNEIFLKRRKNTISNIFNFIKKS